MGRLSLSRWGVVLIFAALTGIERALFGRAISPSLIMFMFVAALMSGCLFLGPIPWQWTGDERKCLTLARGSLQSLAWNALWIALLTAVFLLLEQGLGRRPSYPPRLLDTARRLGLHPLIIVGILALPLIYLIGWFIAEREAAVSETREALERQRSLRDSLQQAEARALQAELDPHVLYNALGALAELARRDPGKTERALLDFSSYYRQITACARSSTITLAGERHLLELYLGIEQLRFGDRLSITWCWPEALETLRIPPLLIQPVVENAIKHGLAPADDGGGLRLEARRDRERLVIRVENGGIPLDGPWVAGTGLANLRKRLDNLSPSGTFQMGREGDRTVAELVLPFEAGPSPESR